MGLRLPSPCRQPGCPATVIGGGYCPTHAPAVDTPPFRRPETTAIYSTPRWRKLRAEVIRQHPLCAECGQGAYVVDHKVPIASGGDPWDEDNLEPLCTTCHNRKRGYESQRAAGNLPSTRATVVCGPPGAGKTTWVMRQMKWGEMIIDLDRIVEAISGMPHHNKPAGLLPVAEAMRRAALSVLAKPHDVPHVWAILGGARRAHRDHAAFQLASARVVVLRPSKSTCMAHILADHYRAERAPQWAPVVDRWFTEYEPGGEDLVLDDEALSGPPNSSRDSGLSSAPDDSLPWSECLGNPVS